MSSKNGVVGIFVVGVLLISLVAFASASIYDYVDRTTSESSKAAAQAAVDAELAAAARAKVGNDSDDGTEDTGRVGIRIGDREISIRDLSPERKEIIAGRINAKTGLNLTAEDLGNGTVGSILRAYLSNGRYALIKVLPERAAATALARLRAQCETRNCTVELKEVGKGDNARAAYEVQTEKDAKILFIFKKKMRVSAEVDAETGEVISVKKPWWSFSAKEKNETPDIE